jgi:site-specific DNA recombinase
MKKVALYVRVSTQEQAEKGYSIPEQIEKLEARCLIGGPENEEWQAIKPYVVDPGHTGKDTNREGLQLLLSRLKDFDIVAVYKLDRLSRSQKDTLTLIEDYFLKNKVDVVSLQENFDTTTAVGRAMIGIMAAFAQLEREYIIERSLMGRTGRAKDGKWIGTNRPPIGYDYDQETKSLVINPYEAEQVKMVFALYLQGTGLQRIARIMNEKGFSHKYGDWTWWGGVHTMLSNPVYIGMVKFSKEFFPGKHEPIVDKETFDTVQDLLKTRSTSQLYKRVSPLSHLLFCGSCGAKMFNLRKTGREPN